MQKSQLLSTPTRTGREAGNAPAPRNNTSNPLDPTLLAGRQLSEAFLVSEADFVNLGGTVEVVHEKTHELVDQLGTLAEISIGKIEDFNIIQATSDHVHYVMELTDREYGMGTQWLKYLNDYVTRGNQVLGKQKDFLNCTSTMGYIWVIFRIEVASLTTAQQEVFHNLADQMADYDTRMKEVLGRQFAALEGSCASISALYQSIQELGRDQEKRIRQSHVLLEKIDREILAGQQTQEHFKGELTVLIQQLKKVISVIVSGLQFHDIISQRQSHVVQCLGELHEMTRERNFLNSSVNKQLFRGAHLQLCQLEDIHKDIAQAKRTLQDGFAELLQIIGQIRTKTESGSHSTKSQNKSNELMDHLVEFLQEGVENAHRFDGLHQAMDTALGPLSEIAQDLTHNIEDLSISIRLLAINTEIQAVQVGENNGLYVLATQARLMSDKIMALNTGLNQDLKEMQKLIHSIREDVSESKRNVLLTNQELVVRTRQATQGILYVEVFESGLKAEIEQTILQISDSMTQMPTSLGFSSQIETSLIHLGATLSQFTEEYFHSKNREWLDEPDLLQPSWSAHYSMESERKTHQAACDNRLESPSLFRPDAKAVTRGRPHSYSTVTERKGGPRIISPQASAVLSSQSEDLGSNVELF